MEMGKEKELGTKCNVLDLGCVEEFIEKVKGDLSEAVYRAYEAGYTAGVGREDYWEKYFKFCKDKRENP